jgi:hypothetical protein
MVLARHRQAVRAQLASLAWGGPEFWCSKPPRTCYIPSHVPNERFPWSQ